MKAAVDDSVSVVTVLLVSVSDVQKHEVLSLCEQTEAVRLRSVWCLLVIYLRSPSSASSSDKSMSRAGT